MLAAKALIEPTGSPVCLEPAILLEGPLEPPERLFHPPQLRRTAGNVIILSVLTHGDAQIGHLGGPEARRTPLELVHDAVKHRELHVALREQLAQLFQLFGCVFEVQRDETPHKVRVGLVLKGEKEVG